MVMTCQTVEFGRATTVLGTTVLCKLLIGKLGVDKAPLNTETQYYTIIINNTLSWNNHTDSIIKKLSKACYIIRNSKTCMSVS